MELLSPPKSSLADAFRQRWQHEWRSWDALATAWDSHHAEIENSDQSPLVKQVESSFVPGELGRQILFSEHQVSLLAAKAMRVRDKTPSVWTAFSEGRINEAKASEISSAVDRLQRPPSIERLDRQVIAYAERHTVAELRRWLKLFVARVEADLFNERAERGREDRGVFIEHGDGGMSSLTVTNTSIAIAAIQKRLRNGAKAFGKDDARTLDQREADLLTHWATCNEAGEPAAHIDVAVTMPVTALTGDSDQPAASPDGCWVVPSSWVLELVRQEGTSSFWHRMILDPVTDDVLAHDYVGRYAPAVLDKALEFRDGVCQAPGCCRPAWDCDDDHRVPAEEDGPTTGWNMGPYCRRHHIQKGFGLLDTGPTAKSPPGRSRNTPFHPVGTPERQLEHLLIDWYFDTAA